MSRDFGTHTHGEDGIIIPIPLGGSSSGGLSDEQETTLKHIVYDEESRKLIADRAIETTLNSLYLGEQHKMSSGAENIFFTNLGNNTNFYPMWGGLKDQSVEANQGASGFIPPSGRVYSDLISIPLGGSPDPATAVGYSGGNYFGVNIAGLGITTVAAEEIPATVRLEYRLSVNNKQVYMQVLPRGVGKAANDVILEGDVIEWFFDHPVEIHAGTTIYAEIRCVRDEDDVDLGVFQVRQGDTVDPNTGLYRYQAIVHNRLFEDKDLEFISPYLKYEAMNFSDNPNSEDVLFSDPVSGDVLQPHPYGFLQAVGNDDGTTIKIKVKDGSKVFIESLPMSGATIEGVAVNATQSLAVNELNALFQQTGGSTGQLPSITSSLTPTMVEGSSLNYELTADYGVGYEWYNLPPSVSIVEGNSRKLIGGTELAPGTYDITASAINYNGMDTETITLTVTDAPFSNTKSIKFASGDYMGANAALLDSTLGRTGSGAGSSDAWTIAFWFKGGTDGAGQTIFYYGSSDVTNGGYVEARYVGGSDKLRLRYGSGNNYLQFTTPNNTLPANSWQHVVITYDGGTTGASSGSLSNYYNRFSVFIDGVLQTLTNTHGNYGWSGAISGQNLRVGRFASGNYLQNCFVEELAVWGSDESSNVSDIYNSGTLHDLSDLSSVPAHYWRMGDDDTYPTIQDNVGSAHFVMYNMTAASIVTDTP